MTTDDDKRAELLTEYGIARKWFNPLYKQQIALAISNALAEKAAERPHVGSPPCERKFTWAFWRCC